MFGLIGPDGAGKTTRCASFAGCCGPTAARCASSATTRSAHRAAATHAIGYLSQRFSLYGDLSMDENIEFFARLHGVRDFEPRRDAAARPHRSRRSAIGWPTGCRAA